MPATGRGPFGASSVSDQGSRCHLPIRMNPFPDGTPTQVFGTPAHVPGSGVSVAGNVTPMFPPVTATSQRNFTRHPMLTDAVYHVDGSDGSVIG